MDEIQLQPSFPLKLKPGEVRLNLFQETKVGDIVNFQGRPYEILEIAPTPVPTSPHMCFVRARPYFRRPPANVSVDGLLESWALPANIAVRLRPMLEELSLEALASLFDRRFEIAVTPETTGVHTWISAGSLAHMKFQQRPRRSTHVLLTFSEEDLVQLSTITEAGEAFHAQLGCALLYLRDPEAENDSAAGINEWHRCCARAGRASS